MIMHGVTTFASSHILIHALHLTSLYGSRQQHLCVGHIVRHNVTMQYNKSRDIGQSDTVRSRDKRLVQEALIDLMLHILSFLKILEKIIFLLKPC